MENIYKEIVKALEKGEKIVLATVVRQSGSAPRGPGAQMIVRADGSFLGTVGGGSVEAEALVKARALLAGSGWGMAEMVSLSLAAGHVMAGPPVCGGDVDILVERLNDLDLGSYREALQVKGKGGTGVLITPLPGKGLTGRKGKVFLAASGERFGTPEEEAGIQALIPEGVPSFVEAGRAKVFAVPKEEGEALYFLEPVFADPTVFIFGAGHVGRQVAFFSKRVHFRVVVIDDREEFANRGLFPEADDLRVTDIPKSFETLRFDGSSYIVIVTRGHLHDGEALENALRTPARYVGMIGSKRKIRMIYEHLTGKGIPREALDRVHAPIGVDIGAETPEEIAVSIVAELIKVRARGDGTG